MHDIQAIRYEPSMKREWDEFTLNSKNGTFLLQRDYMDYHADRFADCSLVFLKDKKPCALLPACRHDGMLSSHAGLTYGGLIMGRKTTASDVLEIFEKLLSILPELGVKGIIYKPVPHIYHSIPSEEDLYALFRNYATLVARNIASVVNRHDRIKFRDIRKYGIRKALANGITICESHRFHSFWDILSKNLKAKYDSSPVHSLSEITRLSNLFPENIKLFEACRGEVMLAGTLCYITKNVVHTQYISASPEGKELGALDLLFERLLNEEFDKIKYFDFGTSNGDNGKYLNETLIYQKEGFGGRGICYDTYKIEV